MGRRLSTDWVTPWAALALTTFAFQFLYYSTGTHETGVVAGDQGAVGDLLEGTAAGLARLQLDQVEQLALVAQDEIVEAQQDGPALPQRHLRPLRLHRPAPLDGRRDILGRAHRQIRQWLAGQRCVGPLTGAVRTRDHQRGEPMHEILIHPPGGGRIDGRTGSDVHHELKSNFGPGLGTSFRRTVC